MRAVRIRRWLPPLAWALLVFAASTVPSLGRLPFGQWGADKLIHFCEYLILGYLIHGAIAPRADSSPAPSAGRIAQADKGRQRTAMIGLALCAAWAVLDEAHQALVPTRSPEALDLACDLVGSAVGIHLRRVRHGLGAQVPKGDS